jgi:hypothetical protein
LPTDTGRHILNQYIASFDFPMESQTLLHEMPTTVLAGLTFPKTLVPPPTS